MCEPAPVNRLGLGRVALVAAAAFAFGACGSSRPTLEEVAKPLAVFAGREAKAPGAAFFVRDRSRVLDAEGHPTTVEAVRHACEARSDCWWVHVRALELDPGTACLDPLTPAASGARWTCYDVRWRKQGGAWSIAEATVRQVPLPDIDGSGFRPRLRIRQPRQPAQ